MNKSGTKKEEDPIMKKMAIMMAVVAGGMLMFAGCSKEQTNQEKLKDSTNKVNQAADTAVKDTKAAAQDASKGIQKSADSAAKDIKAATK